MADDYISINFSDAPHISKRESGFLQGERYCKDYDEKDLLEMLRHGDIHQIYEALGAIGKIKLKSALPQLQTIALYILRFLKTTEHKELINEIIENGA